MQYDFNKALYTLKKMIKNADMEVLDYQLAERALVEMADYAGEVGLLPVKLSVSHCLAKMNEGAMSSALIHDLEEIRKHLLIKKEKTQVMQRREAQARNAYFRNKGPKHMTATVDLQKYDVIMVPTQGGFHYSIVTKVHGNMVECFPMTTATEKQLSMIGCSYYKLQDRTSKGQPIYLTSSKTLIPYHAAARSFVRPYEHPQSVDEALLQFAA